MRDRKRTWIAIAIIIAILLIGYWVFFSPEVRNDVQQQSKDVIEDLTLD